MADVNHVILIGRLTKDLGSDERSFGYVNNGQARANVSIAVNRNKKVVISGLMKLATLMLQFGEKQQKT
jgi:single-stranded DNA-binding protein